jgi:hypothetical protein
LLRGLLLQVVLAGRTDAERERLPPLVECRVLDVEHERDLLHVDEVDTRQELRELSLARTCPPSLPLGAGIQLPHHAPERRERRAAAGHVPDGRGDDAAGSGDARHLRDAAHRIVHEVHDQLRERRVEASVLERELLRRRLADVDAPIALANRVDELRRGIDGGDVRTTPHELRDQRTRPATHIEHALPLLDAGEVGQLRTELHRVPAHEAVVGVCCDVEGHRRQAYAVNVVPFVVQATPATQQLGALTISDRGTYQDAIDAYGKPSACLPRKPWQPFATAVWRTEGFRLKITSLGYIPPGKTFCTAPRRVYIDTAIATGKRWHTTRGLRIGDTAAKLHRLYPHARRFREGWGIVQVFSHCGAGICQGESHWVPRLAAVLRNGRVAAFVFPVGAEGD